MNRNFPFLLILVSSILCPGGLFAQEHFDLEKRDGHFHFAATINGAPADIMVESGIPALLVGEKIYESHLRSSDLDFQPSGQKIRLLNHLYNIIYRTDGEVRISNVIYDGPVFILEDYDGASIPIQYLKDPVSRRSVLAIDLENNSLTVGQPIEKVNGTRFRLSFDKDLGFPVVAATVKLATSEGDSRLKGNLIIDFGNPSLLFLLRQDKSLTKAINKKRIELKDAYDKNGRLIAQGIYAETVSLFGQEHHDISIGVTDQMQSIGQMGFLGTKFFTSPVVFDFDKGFMMME